MTSSSLFGAFLAEKSSERESTTIYFNDFSRSVNQKPAYSFQIVNYSSTLEPSFGIGMLRVQVENNAALDTSYKKIEYLIQELWVDVYKLDAGGFGRLAAQEIMLFVERNLRRNGLVEVNRLLETADVAKLSSRCLIGLIRSTARLKDKIPAWKAAYLKSRDELARKGKNPDALFVGLP